MYALKSYVFPSFAIILLGAIDAITTALGVMYFGAVELNPFLTGIISTNIFAFLAVKILAAFMIGFTYILAKKTLDKAPDKESRSFKYSNKGMQIAYAGIIVFLIIVVINNLIILIA